MEVVKISPAGFCYGVVDAMVIAYNATLDANLPRPIYILGMIVHNAHLTKAYEELGIITLDGENRLKLLEKVDEGTVIFTAHGVSPKIVEKAIEKGLTTIDASCPDVLIIHELIKKYIDNDYEIIYIGKKKHPEPEGAIGIAPKRVHLVSERRDIDRLTLKNKKIFVTNQTTMSVQDTADLIIWIKKKYPAAEVHKEICQATWVRQAAVARGAVGCDLTIIVGDSKSNNSNRLAQVSIEQAGVPAQRVADISEINPEWFKNVKKVAVSAGASTPTAFIREVVKFLEQFDYNDPETWDTSSRITHQDILPKISGVKDLSKKRSNKLQQLSLKNGLTRFP